jgi:hypothetical protein
MTDLTQSQQEDINLDFALFFYTQGISYRKIDDPHLRRALKKLRPQHTLINRHQLGGEVLKYTYDTIKKLEAPFIANSYGCLISDGWTNTNGDSIINYMVSIPSKGEIFLESVNTQDHSHTSEYIANDISRVFDLGYSLAGCVMDNTSANRKAQRILREKYPKKFFYGCICHGLHLLAKDLLGIKEKEKKKKVSSTTASTSTSLPPTEMISPHNEDDMPEVRIANPLLDLAEFIETCKEVVIFFKKHGGLKHKLEEIQEESGFTKLCLPGATRWGSVLSCIQSLQQSHDALFSLVSSTDFVASNLTAKQKEGRYAIQKIVMHNDFLNNLRKVKSILEPIDSLIVKFQNNNVPISEVYHQFMELKHKMLDNILLNTVEHNYILNMISRRWEFMYTIDVHGIAYMLDPRYHGEKFTTQELSNIRNNLMWQKFIVPNATNENAPISNEIKLLIDKEYTDFKIYCMELATTDAMQHTRLRDELTSVLDFWRSTGRSMWPHLYNIAIRLFSLCASSAASERNFSQMGYLHNKQRNLLSDKSVEMLTYIKNNSNLFIPQSSMQNPEAFSFSTISALVKKKDNVITLSDSEDEYMSLDDDTMDPIDSMLDADDLGEYTTV